MEKVLCIGDSLALPGHLNIYEDTWNYKLKKELPQYDFITFFKRQLTSDVLVTMGGGKKGIDNWPKGADCLEAYKPDIIIVQLGIVDCAPRLLTKYDKLIVKYLPDLFGKTYIKLLKKVKRRKDNNTLVPFEKFKSNWLNYVMRVEQFRSKIIIISISIPDDSLIDKNKNIVSNVKKYNAFFEDLSKNYGFISVTKPLDPVNYNESIYEDGYHPNNIGHGIIFNELMSLLHWV